MMLGSVEEIKYSWGSAYCGRTQEQVFPRRAWSRISRETRRDELEQCWFPSRRLVRFRWLPIEPVRNGA